MDRPIRLIEILQLLGGRRSWRPAEIADHFNISERTVYRDLQDLSRLQSIPVTRDEDGYRLLEGASIRWLGLTSNGRGSTSTSSFSRPGACIAAEPCMR